MLSGGQAGASDSSCALTQPNGYAPPGAPPQSFNHGAGQLGIGLWTNGKPLDDARFVRRDGSIEFKFGAWRGVDETLRIRGRRLDAAAPELRADITGEGYGAPGFVPAPMTFPTRGCWSVTETLGSDSVTLVLLVTVGRDVRPEPVARLRPPRVRSGVVTLTWRGTEAVESRFDVAVRRAGERWRTVKLRLTRNAYDLRPRYPGRYEARVRASDLFGPGAWSLPVSFTIR